MVHSNMIDSVNFRLHNISSYQAITSQIFTIRNARSVQNYQMPAEMAASFDNVRQFIKYFDTGKMIPLIPWDTMLAGNKSLPSSHYGIAYRIDFQRDYLDLNVSIPKYFFGHNIMQFVPDIYTTGFNMNMHSDIRSSSKHVYTMLVNFIKDFFLQNFTQTVFNEHLEIVSFDVCFNAYFNNKADALSYLSMLKEIRLKGFKRGNDDFRHNWTTTLSYYSEFKNLRIYHKGEEYAANDRKRHNAVNRKKKKNVFDVGFLQSEADKIIRYEVRYMYKYMSYWFRHNDFRVDDPRWRRYVKDYNVLRNLDHHGRLLEAPQHMKRFYRFMNKTLHKVDRVYITNEDPEIQRYLKVSPILIVHNLETGKYTARDEPKHFNRIRFTRKMFDACLSDFLTTVDQFKIQGFPTDQSLYLRIDKYIEELRLDAKHKKYMYEYTGKKPPPVPRRSVLVNLVEKVKNMTFEQIEVSKVYPRQTWYRYRKHLEAIGITKGSFPNAHVVDVDFTYQTYYMSLLRDYQRFIPKN